MIMRLFFMLILFLAGTGGGSAEEMSAAVMATKQATALGAAYSVPVSEARVIARLQTPGGGEFFAQILDGGMLRIINEASGETHGFVVKRQSDASRVLLHQYLIEQHLSGGGEVLTSLDQSLMASLVDTGPTKTALTAEGYSFELLEFVDAKSAVPAKSLMFPQAVPQKSTCCISCAGFTVCGCSVSACGSSCCAGSYCGGGDPSP